MNRTPLPWAFLPLGLLVVQDEPSALAAVNPESCHPREISGNSLGLGPYIEIWTAGVDNLQPAVEYNGLHDECLIVCVREYDERDDDIYARRINRDSAGETDRMYVGTAGDTRSNPEVACDGQSDKYLIVLMTALMYTEGASPLPNTVCTASGARITALVLQEWGVHKATAKAPRVTAKQEMQEYGRRG